MVRNNRGSYDLKRLTSSLQVRTAYEKYSTTIKLNKKFRITKDLPEEQIQKKLYAHYQFAGLAVL